MGVNIGILLFCLVLGFLAFRFGLPRAKTAAVARRLGGFFLFLALLLSANTGMAWLGRRALVAAIDTAPTRTAAQWAALSPGTEVVLAGRLSPAAKSDEPDYAAYVHCWSGCAYHGPKPLPVAIEGGQVDIGNDDYEPRGWGVRSREPGMSDGESITYLEPESDVVVVGAVAAPSPAGAASVTALVVYAGGHQAFVERAQRKLVWPTVLLYANALFGLIAIGLGATLLLRRDD